jgi:hypothetical protein
MAVECVFYFAVFGVERVDCAVVHAGNNEFSVGRNICRYNVFISG